MHLHLTEEEISSLQFYISQSCPNVSGSYDFKSSNKSDAHEAVTWIDGEDFTRCEVAQLLQGQYAFQKLTQMFAELVTDEREIQAVCSKFIHNFYYELNRCDKLPG